MWALRTGAGGPRAAAHARAWSLDARSSCSSAVFARSCAQGRPGTHRHDVSGALPEVTRRSKQAVSSASQTRRVHLGLQLRHAAPRIRSRVLRSRECERASTHAWARARRGWAGAMAGPAHTSEAFAPFARSRAVSSNCASNIGASEDYRKNSDAPEALPPAGARTSRVRSRFACSFTSSALWRRRQRRAG